MGKDTDYNKLIRKGLKRLNRADRLVLRAAFLLAKLEGIQNPPTLDSALKKYKFRVEKRKYVGRMTKKQRAYLQSQTDSLKKFGRAILRLLAGAHCRVCDALGDLNKSLDPAEAQHEAPVANGNGGIPVPVVCCCVIDGQGYGNIPRDECTALQGDWKPAPCVRIPG